MRAYRGFMEAVPNPYEDLTRDELIALLLNARAEVEDIAWTHKPSDDFEGATE